MYGLVLPVMVSYSCISSLEDVVKADQYLKILKEKKKIKVSNFSAGWRSTHYALCVRKFLDANFKDR